MTSQTVNTNSKLLSIAFALALFTIFYNIAEGFLATKFGVEDESLTLFGFGADSFIEVISGLGIARMITRIRNYPDSQRSSFEKQALKITGVAFYLLLVVLVISAFFSFYKHHQPVTTFWGLIISVVSIIVMWGTIIWKVKIGKALNSPAILADAECARVCIYMSVVLLLSSLLFSAFHIPYVDAIGSLFLAYFSYKEGKECFEKANNDSLCSCHSH
jgi:uncharacterized membrane protein